MRLHPLALMLLVLIATPAGAATIISSASDPALAGAVVIDLDSETDGTNFVSAAVGSLTILSNTNTLRFEDDFSVQFGTSGIVLDTFFGGSNDDVELVFAAPVSAFGFNINALDIDLTMNLFDDLGNLIDTFTILNQPGQGMSGFARRGYAGASSATPIARVQLINLTQHDRFLVDNIAFVTVPEASTVVMLGVGLGGLVLAGAPSRRERNLLA